MGFGWQPTDLDEGDFSFRWGLDNDVAFTNLVVRTRYEKQWVLQKIEDGITSAVKACVAALEDQPHSLEIEL